MSYFKINRIKPWGKGFLTSVLGTTISILLTFGTSALIDEKMKAEVQRQTAMMVIHDIDVCVKQMEEMADEEEKRNNAIQYILAHFDQIGSLPEDTLELAMEMIADFEGVHTIFDDAKENIFKSSQDIWGNLDNMAFIDNMEQFYRERREVVTFLMTDPTAKHPIPYEEMCQLRINSSAANGYEIDNAAVLKERLKDREVKFYIDFSSGRTVFYRKCAQRWRDISDRNKFIMNISDEELADYIKNSQRSGSPASKRDLIGQWERKAKGYADIYYNFQENDSFCIKQVVHIALPIWSGEVLRTTTCSGKWSLKGDTLFKVYNPVSCVVEVDTSRITYRPEMRDSVRNYINRVFNVKMLRERMQKSIEADMRDTLPVTTNKAHDKIEMVTSSGEDGVRTIYLKRIKDSDIFKR